MSKTAETPEGQRFEALAKRLLAVPKAAVDEAREKVKRDSSRKPRKTA